MIRTETLTGAATARILDDLAQLRIRVFRDWPYLYDGTLAYERAYLSDYATTDASVIVAAFDDTRLVGAATGMPLADHAEEFGAALAGLEVPSAGIFYCAESVLLPEYRGQGLGHRFFEGREAQARRLGLRYSAFCAVLRPADHPRRPREYRPLDGFWRKRGYAEVPGAQAVFTWKDIDQPDETDHNLQFWIKALDP